MKASIYNSGWKTLKKIFVYTGATSTPGSGSWKTVKKGFIYVGGQWRQFFASGASPVNTVQPSETGSSYLYGNLYCDLGTWTSPDGTAISYARQWQRSSFVSGPWTTISGATSSPYTTTAADDGYYVICRIAATNTTGTTYAYSDPKYIKKYIPSNIDVSISGTPRVGEYLTAASHWQTLTSNTGDTTPDSYSYSWTYGDTGGTASNNSDSQTYLIGSSDQGHTIKVTVTATNTGGSTPATSTATSVIFGAIPSLSIYDYNITEYYTGNPALDNIYALPTALLYKNNAIIYGVDSTSTFRVRYRYYSWQTGYYYLNGVLQSNPNNAWITYSGTYASSGGISNILINGSTATLYDAFYVDSTYYNGSTYSGGNLRWNIEIEIQATRTGQTTQTAYMSYDITAAPAMTLNATPTTLSPGGTVTFTGQALGFPSGYNTYPKYLKLDYGDNTDTGWVSVTGANPQLGTKTHTYSNAGNYTATLTAYPKEYSSATKAITVASGPGSFSVSNYYDSSPTPAQVSINSFSVNSSNLATYTWSAVTYADKYASSMSPGFGPNDRYVTNDFWTITSSNTYTASVYAVNTSTLSVTASWSASTSADYYVVNYTIAGTTYNSSNLTTTSWTLSSTSPVTLNYVKAVNTVGTSYANWYGSVTPTVKNGTPGTSSAYLTYTVPAVIPTITMGSNTGVTQTAGTINWTSTNQSSYSSTGTFSGSGTTGTSISKTGLSASTTYTGTVTVTSSTGNQASANYSLTTSAAATAGSISITSISASRTATRQLTGTWAESRSGTDTSFQWYNTRVRNTANNATATHTLFSESPKSDTFTSLTGTSYRFGIQGVIYDNSFSTYRYSIGSSDTGQYAENGSNINPA